MKMMSGKRAPAPEERNSKPEKQDFEDYLREIRKRLPEWTIVPMDPPRVGLELPSSSLVDEGDRVLGKTGSDREIEAMLELAGLKGWTTLRFEGPEDFVKRASEMALKRGFGLSDMEVLSSVPEPAPRLPEIPLAPTEREPEEAWDDDLKCD